CNSPLGGGSYEFRLFKDNGYSRAATSPTVTVTAAPPPALAVSTTSTPGGSPVTVTLSNGLGGGADWIALAASASAETSYVEWTRVGADVTTRTWTVTMPGTPGAYQF